MSHICLVKYVSQFTICCWCENHERHLVNIDLKHSIFFNNGGTIGNFVSRLEFTSRELHVAGKVRKKSIFQFIVFHYSNQIVCT